MSNDQINQNTCNQDKIWEHFQNEGLENFDRSSPRMDYLIKEINRKKMTNSPTILNIGAGNGYLEKSILELGWDIHTLDPDEKSIKRLIKEGVKANKGYIENIPFEDSKFDFVIASEVLEHLDDIQFKKGLEEVCRVMKKQAWFLGTIPYQENLLLNQVRCPKCGEIFNRWGHQKSFDIKLINNSLLEIFLDVHSKRITFVPLKNRNLIGKIKSILRLVLGFCGVNIWLSNIYFTARK